jgi:hypothetical protein
MPPTHQPTYKSIPVLEDMFQNRLMRLYTPSPLLAQDHVSRPTTTPPTQNHATSPSGSSQRAVESVKEYLLDTGYDADDEKEQQEEETNVYVPQPPHPHHHPNPQTKKQKTRIKTSPHNPHYVNPSKKAQPWDDKYPAPPRGFWDTGYPDLNEEKPWETVYSVCKRGKDDGVVREVRMKGWREGEVVDGWIVVGRRFA